MPVSSDDARDARVDDSRRLVSRIRQVLLETVSQLLDIQVETLDDDTEWSEYGFDSITLTEFSNRLNQRFGLELMPTIFF